MPFGSILSGVGAIAGALGGGDSQTTQQSIQGFKSLPDYVSDYAEEDLFPRITEYGQTGFPTVPYKQYTDTDPIFGSSALRDLQALKKRQAIQASLGAQSQAAPTQAAPIASDQLAAIDFLSRGRSSAGAGTKMGAMYDRITPERYDTLGKLLGQYKEQFGSGAPNFEGLAKFVAGNPDMREDYASIMYGGA